MSYTKPKIYNLTLAALLLSKRIIEVETDTSTEVATLNTHWDTALESTLKDLDLDSLSTPITLELITELTEGPWTYVYKYPTNCAFFRRIKSCVITDNKRTHIAKRVGMYNGLKAIFTNEYEAIAECMPKNIPLVALDANSALALSYKLAILSAPMITGKGAKDLVEKLEKKYLVVKAEAQEADASENFNYEDEALRSEFVDERLS